MRLTGTRWRGTIRKRFRGGGIDEHCLGGTAIIRRATIIIARITNQTMQDRPKRRNSVRKLRGIRAVAQRAGVAVSSVSRAFSPGESVSAETRARIFEAARAVGYIPDAVARS